MKDAMIKVLEGVMRFGGRDIIRVDMDGEVQPFYRSSGRNSGHPGTWFPFDGIALLSPPNGYWFDKERFCYSRPNKTDNLMRYGEEKYRKVSEWLATQTIPECLDDLFEKPDRGLQGWIDINRWLLRERPMGKIWLDMR